MTIEYLDRFQPRIPDVQQKILDVRETPQQKILDVREIPEIRANSRYRTISAGSSSRPRRRSLRSGGGWPILILIAADKQLRHSALRQKTVTVISALRTNRQTKSHKPLHTRIAATGAHSNV